MSVLLLSGPCRQHGRIILPLVIFPMVYLFAWLLHNNSGTVLVGVQMDSIFENTMSKRTQRNADPSPINSVTLKRYKRVQKQHRNEYLKRLEKLYGGKQIVMNMFIDDTKSRNRERRFKSFITSPFEKSWEMPAGEEEQEHPSHHSSIPTTPQYNDAFVRRIAEKLLQGMMTETPENEQPHERAPRFVWASAGMSSAAGHGNMMSEAYSQIMSDNLRPLFTKFNVDFEVRNYGMSGMSSVAELSFCQREIYGADVDVLAWDFGQTDGANEAWKMAFFLWRAGRFLPRPPVLAALMIGETNHKWASAGGKRIAMGRTLRNLGLSVVLENIQVWNEAIKAIPDTVGKTQTDIDRMPVLTRYFKCNGHVESGDPCAAHRFNQTTCNERRWRVSWHPGFKTHALLGHLRSMVLLDAVEDALDWIQSRLELEPTLTAADLIDQLQREDAAKAETFRSPSKIPASFTGPWKELQRLKDDDIDPSIIWNARAYCHTARAPSQNRELGMFEAPTLRLPDAKVKRTSSIKTVLDSLHGIYQHSPEANCTEPVHWDYRDFYFVGQADGWKELVVPTQPELSYYAHQQQSYSVGAKEWLGIVAICSATLSGKHTAYEPGEVFLDDYGGNNRAVLGELEVNGKKVTSTYDLAGDCFLLKHKDGFRFPIIDETVRLRARSIVADRFVRFNSVVVL